MLINIANGDAEQEIGAADCWPIDSYTGLGEGGADLEVKLRVRNFCLS